MLLSHKKKFVFLHIFKTGGTSITRMLLPYSRRRDRAAYGQGRAKQAVLLFNRVAGLQQNGMRHITGYHKFEINSEQIFMTVILVFALCAIRSIV
jgi:hypothetical protein